MNLSYRTKHNETGAPLPGYCENWALMHERAAFNLGQVQRSLRRQGLGLLILDAYRPVRATEALVRWAERTGRGGAVGTYIARRSRHNTGSAVDITLVRFRDGKRLRMGGFALRPQLPHLQRKRAHPPQPADPQERDGALRLQRLPERVVALRALHPPEPLSGRNARLLSQVAPAPAIMETCQSAPTSCALRSRSSNPTVGDIRGNARKISEGIARARDEGASLVVFPELALTGYPPEDLLLKTTFLDAADGRASGAGRRRPRASPPWWAIPEKAEDVYNSAAVLADGDVVATYRKMYLPNYGVFDEQRYFQSGAEAAIVELNGVPIGLSICEDIWEPGPPAMTEALAGAQVILNLSASPYRRGVGAAARAHADPARAWTT